MSFFGLFKKSNRKEEQAQAIIESMSDGVISINEKGIIESFNPAAEKLFGYRANDVLGRNVNILMPEPYRSEHDGYIGNYLATHKAKIIGTGREVLGQKKDGQTFPFHLVVTECKIDGQSYFTAIVRDLSEKQALEEKLHKTKETLTHSQNELFKLLDNLPMAFHLQAEDYSIPFANKAFYKYFGPPKGKMCYELMHHRKAPCENCDTFKAFDPNEKVESVWQAPSGQTFYTICVPYQDIEGRRLVMEMALDITAHEKTKREAIEAKKEAENANEAKSEFLTQMSHELRTPLNAILGFVQLMEMSPDDHPLKAHREHITQVLKAGNHLLSLINEILDLPQIETGKFKLQLEDINITQLLDETINSVEPLTRSNSVQIVKRFDPENDLYVVADAFRLRQVLLNLINNAIKYNKTYGKIFVNVFAEDAQRVRVTIEDTGVGIASDKMEFILQPFNRLKMESVTIDGTGIGLPITKSLLEAMGSSLQSESAVGLGSTFSFELPASQPHTTPAATE